MFQKSGDIICSVDENKINKMQELSEYLYLKSPNDKIILNVLRETENFDVEVILSEK